jgi:hypothetical protein
VAEKLSGMQESLTKEASCGNGSLPLRQVRLEGIAPPGYCSDYKASNIRSGYRKFPITARVVVNVDANAGTNVVIRTKPWSTGSPV